ncbi:MAG: aminotransferase class V-fold PLP-dependent enzyme [bacterium]
MIYLDHAATSFPKPERVFRAMDDFARTSAANPGRGGHHLATEAEAMLEDTRRLLARLFGFSRPERVVFTLNATDALNMAIKGVLKPGDHVITSVLEHNSVSRPLNRLANEGVITLTRLEVGADHRIDPGDVARAFLPATRLVAITQVSNVTGTIQPVDEIGKVVRQRDALFLVDAAQSAGVIPIDMGKASIDLLAFTGHKALLGPTGTGGLLVGERAQVASWREGGTGGDSADPVQPSSYPYHLEGGTPNVMGLAGLREGIRILVEQGIETILQHERKLLASFHGALRDPSKFQWYGTGGGVGLVSLNLPGLAPVELAAILDGQFGIAVRAGMHCAPYAHRHLGTFPDGAVRLSVGWQTSDEDVKAAAKAFNEISKEV